MARPRNTTHSYLLHKRTGTGRAVWTDPTGIRRERSLPGRFGSKESKQAFARLLLELAAGTQVADPDGITLNEILAVHLDHAKKHYRRADGTQTHEVVEYKGIYKRISTTPAGTQNHAVICSVLTRGTTRCNCSHELHVSAWIGVSRGVSV